MFAQKARREPNRSTSSPASSLPVLRLGSKRRARDTNLPWSEAMLPSSSSEVAHNPVVNSDNFSTIHTIASVSLPQYSSRLRFVVSSCPFGTSKL